MKEDASPVGSGSAPEVMVALRNVVIGLVRQAGGTDVAAALRHHSWKVTDALALLGSTFVEIETELDQRVARLRAWVLQTVCGPGQHRPRLESPPVRRVTVVP